MKTLKAEEKKMLNDLDALGNRASGIEDFQRQQNGQRDATIDQMIGKIRRTLLAVSWQTKNNNNNNIINNNNNNNNNNSNNNNNINNNNNDNNNNKIKNKKESGKGKISTTMKYT